MSKKVLSFGELLLRICPDGEGEWLKENALSVYVGGAEANVATALALWGIPSAYFTALPENMMSRQLTGYLEQRAIDTSRIIYRGNRIGLYFLPKGKDLKNAGVIYDRAGSSFSELQPGSIDWDTILQDVGWLHFTAISPALNSQAVKVCEEVLQEASARNITISVDLNYRAKLWQYGKQPVEIMPALVRYCDVVMGNLWAVEKMLGIPVDTTMIGEGRKEDYLRHALETSRKVSAQFTKARIVANTFRFDWAGDQASSRGSVEGVTKGAGLGAGGIQYYTTVFADDQLYHSREYFAEKIVDKVGSGDCYMAGLIYGLYRQRPVQETLEFATAAAFQKLFITSDATDQKAEDIHKFIQTYAR